MKKKMFAKIIALNIIIVTLLPIVTVAIGSNINHNSEVKTNADIDDPKVYRVLLYKEGNLKVLLSADTYHFQMKKNKPYLLQVKIDITEGWFALKVNGPGGDYLESKMWDTTATKDERVIEFIFTPTDAGAHNIIVTCLTGNHIGNYHLFVIQNGFAGWWWMLASGIGLLLLIVIVFAVISRSRKPKRKKRRR